MTTEVLSELIACFETEPSMQRLVSTSVVVDGYRFGQHFVSKGSVIAHTSLSFASVNLKPISKGHILVMPKRVVPRVAQLTFDELGDLWYLAQQMSIMLESKHGSQSTTFAIQDGRYAGQTVEHVHIHVVPRFPKDFAKNDEVYVELEKEASEHVQSIGVEDEKRKAQTAEEMAHEAASYRDVIDATY